MNLWFYITSIITFSLYIGVYYIDAVSTCFHHISKIVPKWLESSWPRKVLCASPPARTWRVACLRSEIVNRTPNLRRHNDHITIIKNTPPPFRESDTKGTTLRQKGPSLRFLHFLCWKNASELLKIYQLWISCLWLVHSPCFSPWSANWNLCKNLKQSKSSAPQMPLKSCSNFTSNFSSSASIAACTCRLQKRPKHFWGDFCKVFLIDHCWIWFDVLCILKGILI